AGAVAWDVSPPGGGAHAGGIRGHSRCRKQHAVSHYGGLLWGSGGYPQSGWLWATGHRGISAARHRGQTIGFVLVTEIAPRQGHLVQVAVLPTYQRQGVGRLLVRHSLARLAMLHFDTLSLIVSRANQRALRLYQALGLQAVLTFPVFVWEQ